MINKKFIIAFIIKHSAVKEMHNVVLHLKYVDAWYPPVYLRILIKITRNTMLSITKPNNSPMIIINNTLNKDEMVISIPYLQYAILSSSFSTTFCLNRNLRIKSTATFTKMSPFYQI